MRQLEELGKKVIQVIARNKELQEENEVLRSENRELQCLCEELEAKVLEKDKASESFEREKSKISNSIEELITNLSSLETAKSEKIKE